MTQLLLAADVGATKADLAVVACGPEHGQRRVVEQAVLRSRDYGGVDELIAAFLALVRARLHAPLAGAALSVAGPVVGGRAELPNLGWTTDAAALAAALQVPRLALVNDLQATARALPHLRPEQLRVLQPGTPQPDAMQAVVAPGTGLGEALLVPDGAGGHRPFPSEGGHADFAPADEEQRALLAWLHDRHAHVSTELVCSGRGIANLHRFLRATGRAGDAPEWAARIQAADDPTPPIVQAALADVRGRSAAAGAVRLFAAILAAETGNVALRALATGGVYLAGGLPPRLERWLTAEPFLRALRGKGRMADLVRRIPVTLVLEPRAALWGALRYGLDALAEGAASGE